jgi:UDPglucose 6-dehydrogenase
MTAPTGFIGLSHLGIVSSIGWASFGTPVVAVDLDPTPVDLLSHGRLPVHEPGLEELFADVRSRMRFTTDPSALADCSLVIVARDVPTDDANQSDASAVLALIDAALPHLPDGVTLALMSQVPPGFTRALGERIRARRPGASTQLYYWVETLIFGRAVERYLKPERLIFGCADPGVPLPAALARGLGRFGCPVFQMTYESAELTKTAINLYLCAGVTYANTLADLCEAVGANWSEMIPALRLDERIGPAAYIRPSLGIAGGNLERDMVTLRDLCRARGVDAAFIDTMIAYNDKRYRWVERNLEEHVFSAVAHPTVAVWGLAYKKNTRSIKNSMALRVIGALRGRCDVRAWDPLVKAGDVDVAAKVVGDRDEALVSADSLLILTDWDDFSRPTPDALAAMRRRVIIDCVGVIDPTRSDLTGVTYVTMGRPASP